jgi:hypothetical protein
MIDAKLFTRLRRAGALLVLGLAVEAGSLLWTRPPTFLLFLGVGATLVGLAVLLFLLTLAQLRLPVTPDAPAP